MKLRDSNGWPIEIYKGKHFHNMLRYLFLTDIVQTWKRRFK